MLVISYGVDGRYRERMFKRTESGQCLDAAGHDLKSFLDRPPADFPDPRPVEIPDGMELGCIVMNDGTVFTVDRLPEGTGWELLDGNHMFWPESGVSYMLSERRWASESSRGGGRPWDAAIPTGMRTGPRKPPYRENGRNGAHSRTPWQTSSSQAARAANARKN